VGTAQKLASNGWAEFHAVKKKLVTALPLPVVCASCGNEHPSLYSEIWACVCGASGPI
jgi:hypothetical protein